MTASIFALTRRRAILATLSPAEAEALRALRSGSPLLDGQALIQLERRQFVRLQETSDGEVWVFSRIGAEIADALSEPEREPPNL